MHAGAWQGGGGLRPVRREARGAHRLRALLPRRDPDCRRRAGDHGPGRPVHAAAGVVHRGGPRRLRRALREVRLPLPTSDAVQVAAARTPLSQTDSDDVPSMENKMDLGMQSSTQDPEPAGRQVPGAGVHCDGGEGLLLQVPGVRDRHARRHHGQLRAGAEDHLHPGGEPLRAGAVPRAGQRPASRLPQGPSLHCVKDLRRE